MDRCPVLAIMTCSSIPAWNRRVAQVAFNEWLVLLPIIPALEQMVFIIDLSLFAPITADAEYHGPELDTLLSGFK